MNYLYFSPLLFWHQYSLSQLLLNGKDHCDFSQWLAFSSRFGFLLIKKTNSLTGRTWIGACLCAVQTAFKRGVYRVTN